MASTRKVIYPIPDNATPAERAALLASSWACPEVSGGKLIPGRVYTVDHVTAAHLVRQKGWSYVDADGKPTDEKPPKASTKPRPGQAGYLGEQLDERIEKAKIAMVEEIPVNVDPPATPSDFTLPLSDPKKK